MSYSRFESRRKKQPNAFLLTIIRSFFLAIFVSFIYLLIYTALISRYKTDRYKRFDFFHSDRSVDQFESLERTNQPILKFESLKSFMEYNQTINKSIPKVIDTISGSRTENVYVLSNIILLEKNQTVDYSKEIDPLSQFRVIHQEILDGKRPLKVSINGYTCCGYANRLYSMLSSLTIALLTDSAFIVRWNHIKLYIREPFNSN